MICRVYAELTSCDIDLGNAQMCGMVFAGQSTVNLGFAKVPRYPGYPVLGKVIPSLDG